MWRQPDLGQRRRAAPDAVTGRASIVPRVVFAAIALLILASAAPTFVTALTADPGHHVAADYTLYISATRGWLEGGNFYLPHQLAGPYQISFGDILYPPVALWLFVPFTILPAALWWAIPVGLTSYAIWRHRPSHLSWPIIAIVLAWQPVEIHLISGNPDLWAVAGVSLGTLYG